MNKRIKRILLIAACTATFLGGFYIPDLIAGEKEPQPARFKPSVFYIQFTPYDASGVIEGKARIDAAKAITDEVRAIKARLDAIELPKMETQLTSLGTYYITGYTSIECGGSTTTASGTTCHKAASISDSVSNPTTCAIDPALHDFGDIFYLEPFGYFIAEDTGSAVKGKHLDLYFWDSEYNYALSITGKYEVFAVEYIQTTYQPSNYDISKLVAEQRTGWQFQTKEEEAKWN